MDPAEKSPPCCPKCRRPLPKGGPCPECSLVAAKQGKGTNALNLMDIPRPGENIAYIGDYEVLEEIARGGMGVVLKARQRSLNREVALKMLLGGHYASAEYKRRFRQEAEAVARLQHPNIVPIYEVGEHEGLLYFSMRLLTGGSLADAPKKQNSAAGSKAQQRWAAEMVAKVAEAMQHAHARGVLHRDLKPSNILLDEAGAPHVADLGLAKLMDEGGGGGTGPLDRLGSPWYMAPEQVEQSKDITVAADVYGLGAVLYELLTHRPPFVGAPLQVLEQVRTREPDPPRKVRPQVDADLETICLKCLEKDPARRYSTAKALADDLRRWLRGEPIHARPVSVAEKLWSWCRRRPQLAFATALISLASLAALITILVLWRTAETANRSVTESGVRDTLTLAQADCDAGDTREALLRISAAQQRLGEDFRMTEWLANRLARDQFMPLWRSQTYTAEVGFARFDLPRGRVITAGVGGTWLHEAATGRELAHLPSIDTSNDPSQKQVQGAWVCGDGNAVLVHEFWERLALWDISHPASPSLLWSNQACALLAMAPDQRACLFAETNGALWFQAIGSTNGLTTRSLPPLPMLPSGLAVSSDGVCYVSLTNGRILACQHDAWA